MRPVNEIFNKIPAGMPFPLVLDGPAREKLIELGMPKDSCLAQWVMEHPSVYQDMVRSCVRAGANIMTSPTSDANRSMLNKYNLGANTPDYTRRLVGITIEVAMAWHCGAMGLTGKTFEQGIDYVKTYEEIFKIYHEQAAEMDKVTVNFFFLEGLTSLLEAKAAVAAIKDAAKNPVIFVSFKVDKDGKTESGDELVPSLLTLADMGINAFGCNGNIGPDDMLKVLKPVAPYAVKLGIPLIAQPEAVTDEKTYSEEDFYNFTKECINNGILIVGACYGPNEAYIQSIRKAVDEVKFDNEELLNSLQDDDMVACTNNRSAKIDLSSVEILAADEKLFDVSDKDFVIVEVKTPEEADFIINNSYKIDAPLAVKGSIKAIKHLKKYYNGKVVDVSRALRG